MRLLIVSENDKASTSMRDRLLALSSWREDERFEGRPSYSLRDMRMIEIGQEHLFRDNVDMDAESFFHEKTAVVTYLSRHRSESGHKSLTLHPIGNYHQADFGGKPATLVPSAPALMTGTLRALREAAKGLTYAVSFEATHHGPYLTTPTFFIEAGSDLAAWSDTEAATALATAIVNARPAGGAIGIGVGGGHYMPRITDVALAKNVCFGHMIPSYALEGLDEPVLETALSATKGAEFVYFHRKALSKPVLRRTEDWFTAHDIRVVREEELPPLSQQGV